MIFRVSSRRKMTFARQRVDGKLKDDRSTIIYNSRIRLGDIPDKTYDYVVNGKSAIEWVMDRYRVQVDPDGLPALDERN